MSYFRRRVLYVSIFALLGCGGGHYSEETTLYLNAINEKDIETILPLTENNAYQDENHLRNTLNDLQLQFGTIEIIDGSNLPDVPGPLAMPSGYAVATGAIGMCSGYSEMQFFAIRGSNGNLGIMRLFFEPGGEGSICEINFMRKE